MTNQEIQKLLDDGVTLLKSTTVGYASHGTAWQNNTSTKWWQGLDKIAQARKALAPAQAASGTLYEHVDFEAGTIPSPWGASQFFPTGTSYGVVNDPLGVQGKVLLLKADYASSLPTSYTSGALQQTAVHVNPPYAHAGQLPDLSTPANMESWYKVKFMAPIGNRFPSGEGPPLVEWHNTNTGAGPKSSTMMCYSGYPLVSSGTSAAPKIIFRNTLVDGGGNSIFKFFPGNTSDENAAVAAAPTFTLGAWHTAVFHFIWSTSSLTGLFEWWLDDVQYASVTTQTQTPGDYYSFGVYCYRYNITASTSFYYDELSIGSTSGAIGFTP